MPRLGRRNRTGSNFADIVSVILPMSLNVLPPSSFLHPPTVRCNSSLVVSFHLVKTYAKSQCCKRLTSPARKVPPRVGDFKTVDVIFADRRSDVELLLSSSTLIAIPIGLNRPAIDLDGTPSCLWLSVNVVGRASHLPRDFSKLSKLHFIADDKVVQMPR